MIKLSIKRSKISYIFRGVFRMATKSIYKNVNIKSKDLTKGLINALEYGMGKKAKEVIFTKSVEEVKGEDIKKYFGVR